MEKLITCPLTNQIFHSPVIASDGYTYEYLAILDWFKNNHISPITKERINNILIINKKIKEIVSLCIDENPELKVKQFMDRRHYFYFKNEFLMIIKSHQWEKLLDYSKIFVNDTVSKKMTIFEYLCANCSNNDIIKYIIDHSVDYDTTNMIGNRPIHIATKLSNFEIVQHLVSKSVEIDPEDNDGLTPLLHLVMRNGDINLIKYLIEKGADIEHIDRFGKRCIHYAVVHEDNHCIDILIDNKVNLEAEIVGLVCTKPIHVACRYGKNKNTILKLLEKNVDLNSVNQISGSCDELIYKNTVLGREDKQELVFKMITKMKKKKSVVDNYLA
jgi:ankyrin repeat protein